MRGQGMIVGMGTDIVDIDRIRAGLERHGRRYAAKILTSAELELLAPADSLPAASRLAGRFAAKEAAVKALGTGFSDGIGLHDVEILADPHGKPLLIFAARAEARRLELGARRSHISISHERQHAVALVILED